MQPANVKSLSAVTLMALVLLLAGCATRLPPSVVESPSLPKRPELTQPLPSETYSSRAQSDIEGWQKKLTDTLPTFGR